MPIPMGRLTPQTEAEIPQPTVMGPKQEEEENYETWKNLKKKVSKL